MPWSSNEEKILRKSGLGKYFKVNLHNKKNFLTENKNLANELKIRHGNISLTELKILIKINLIIKEYELPNNLPPDGKEVKFFGKLRASKFNYKSSNIIWKNSFEEELKKFPGWEICLCLNFSKKEKSYKKDKEILFCNKEFFKKYLFYKETHWSYYSIFNGAKLIPWLRYKKTLKKSNKIDIRIINYANELGFFGLFD